MNEGSNWQPVAKCILLADSVDHCMLLVNVRAFCRPVLPFMTLAFAMIALKCRPFQHLALAKCWGAGLV